jgi:cation:H+ antiporter
VLIAAATRAGAPELAVGAVFGANMTNLALVAVGDLAYSGDSLLGDLLMPRAHLLFAVEGIFLTNLVVIALIYGKSRRRKDDRPIMV